MTSWKNVPVTDLNNEPITALRARAQLLWQWRRQGECPAWLVTPEELSELSDDEAVDAGPSVDEIDWAGIESYL